VLDGVEVPGISAALRPAGVDPSAARRLPQNRGKAFQGPMPVGKGFLLDSKEAEQLLRRTEARYRDVVRPYLIGEDIAEDPAQAPRRHIVDFGLQPLEEAMRYPAALEIVQKRVKTER